MRLGVPPLVELTPSAERRSLSLGLEPTTTPFAPTDLAEMVAIVAPLGAVCPL